MRSTGQSIIRTPQETMYAELGWVPLSTSRNELRLNTMHKIMRICTPKNLYDCIPNRVADKLLLKKEEYYRYTICKSQSISIINLCEYNIRIQ